MFAVFVFYAEMNRVVSVLFCVTFLMNSVDDLDPKDPHSSSHTWAHSFSPIIRFL